MLEISEVCVTVVCRQTNKQTTTKKISLRMDVKQEEEPSSFLVFFVFFCFVLQRCANYSCSARGEGGAEPH